MAKASSRRVGSLMMTGAWPSRPQLTGLNSGTAAPDPAPSSLSSAVSKRSGAGPPQAGSVPVRGSDPRSGGAWGLQCFAATRLAV